LGRKEADPRFSDDGEIFYLHHPTPGTDGSGHFADSPNGRKHQVLAQLIWALATSYSTRSDAQQACWLMERFVKPYLAIANDEFKHYLYIPLQAMRAGKETLNLSNIHGWDEQEKDLQKELYDNLKDKYGIYVGVTALQGAAEVAAEWEVIGGVFKVIGKGFKLAGKGIGKAWVKYMPKRTRVVLRQNIVDPWRKLRGKPTRAQVKGAQRVAQDVAQEERALAVQYRLGDLTEEEYSAALESLRKEQARQLAVRGLAH
jgi:hypothetical protein